jgi:hypothetical protein
VDEFEIALADLVDLQLFLERALVDAEDDRRATIEPRLDQRIE